MRTSNDLNSGELSALASGLVFTYSTGIIVFQPMLDVLNFISKNWDLHLNKKDWVSGV